jgi:hypothetical protein
MNLASSTLSLQYIRRLIATFFLVAIWILPQQLSAQPTSKHGPKTERPVVSSKEKDDVRHREKIMFAFADCLVSRQRNRRRAFEFVALDPDGFATSAAGKKVADPNCLPDIGRHKYIQRLTLNLLSFRYELLGALYRHIFVNLPDESIANLRDTSYPSEFADGKVPESLLGLRKFGDCVARSTPAASHRLVFTELYSDREKAAIGDVMPKLQSCMPPGQDVRFTRALLRGAVAEGLLRLRQAQNVEKGAAE